MITRVRLKFFKQFRDQTFELGEHIVLAGPNNSGKSTLLQAIAVWSLALRRWREQHHKTKGARRRAIPITRQEFTAFPLREMNLLWTDASTHWRKGEHPGVKVGHPRPSEICVEGREGEERWALTFQIRYQSAAQIYLKPDDHHRENLPAQVEKIDVVHIPPFSGIGVEETRYDRPYQDLLIGLGRPGDLLRNLLLEAHGEPEAWKNLCDEVKEIFHYQLLPPSYEGTPHIRSEYLPGIPEGGKRNFPRLDIACAGSGFHQVLLLLAFFHARPASVLLLDEPDAHQHVILQKQIYDALRRSAARRGSQLIIATHSEVLLNNTDARQILSFFETPHLLEGDVQRKQVAEALKRLPALDLILADLSPGVLYVEGETDFNLLRAWAKVLDHPLHEWFRAAPFWHSNRGRQPREAKGHFFALKALRPEIRGVLILDGDYRKMPDREVTTEGLHVERWRRYEAESYLLHPAALLRYVREHASLLSADAEEFLRDQLPPAVYRDPLTPHDYLEATPASKTLLPHFFQKLGLRMSKQEYYMLAEQMQADEIPAEITEKLDRIASVFGLNT